MLNEILSIIQDARIANVYHMSDDSIILKLRKEAPIGELRIIPGNALYLVRGAYEKPKELSQKGKLFRELLTNAKIIGAEIVEGERIAVFKLKKGESDLRLVCEFLPRGTLVILDDEGKILAALRHLEMKDRKIAPGEYYKLPPPKPAPSPEKLPEILQNLTPRKSIVAALAAEAGFGGRYAEEILHLAGIDFSRKVRDLSADDLNRILDAAQKVLDSVKRGPPVVARSPEGEVQALPYPMSYLKEKGWRYEEVEELNEAIRIAYEHELARAIEEERKAAVEERIKELERKVHEKKFTAQRLLEEASNRRKLAEKLFQLSSILESFKEKPGVHKLEDIEVSVDEARKKMKITVNDLGIELDLRNSIMKQLSSLFDDAKKARQAAERLLSEAEELERKVEKLRKSMHKEIQQALLQVSARIKRGEGKWYEKYRWFITSEGFLTVAGKDASSNISLLKKHLESDDLVFHAEVRGAAAVILKKGKEAGEKSRHEAAQFAAVYSRAWKEGVATMTVYFIEPHQISFTPPPGHYLPKGGFIIKGERNYLTVKLELAIGLTENLEVVYGPPSAVAAKTKRFIKLTPGNKRAKELIDEIVKKLTRGLEVDSKTLRDLKMELEELIPYGRGRLAE